MMKKTILLSLLFPALICSAQWNNNTSENLNISRQVNDRTPIQAVKTTEGKTWIAFYKKSLATGNYDMWAQLLSIKGEKLLGDSGMLVSDLPAGGGTSSFYVCIDSCNNLVIGFDCYVQGKDKAVIFKVDQRGKKLWGENGIILGNGLSPYPATLSNGQTVVVWSKSNYGLNMQKIKSNGEKAWDSTVNVNNGRGRLTNGIPIPNLNGTFTLIAQQVVSAPYAFIYTMRYNANGKPLWKTAVQLNTTSTQTYRPVSTLAEKDTTYIGYTYSGLTQVGFIQRIDPDGSLPYGINGSNFAFDTAAYQQKYVGITTNNNLPYIWGVCWYSDIDQNKNGIKVQKFRKKDGVRLFGDSAKLISTVRPAGNIPINPVAVTNNNNLIFTYRDTSYKYRAISLNLDGTIKWTKPVMLSSTKQLYVTAKLFETFTYNYKQGVLVWEEDRGKGYQIYAQNIWNNGTTGGQDAFSELQSYNAVANKTGLTINNLSVYPNPVKDVVNVKITSQTSYKATLSITSVSGQLLAVKQITVNQGETNQQINVGSFSAGTYFLKLLSEDRDTNFVKAFIK